MKYEVEFEENGVTTAETYRECKDAGMAFARAQKDHPGAKMIRAWTEGEYGRAYGRTDYEYPTPVQRDYQKPPRPYRTPKPDEKDGIMPFYDEVYRQGGLAG